MKRPAIFIDRDGTLIEEVNFLSRVEDLRVFDFSSDAIRSLKDAGFLIIVVTNQSGIGREIYTESDMHLIHDQLQVDLDNGIDGFYFCPHLPDDGCECRKPNLGMIRAAQADFDIDLDGSWMIGDKKIDVETGYNANIQTVMVLTGYGVKHQALLEHPPTLISVDFGKAAVEIISLGQGKLATAEIVL